MADADPIPALIDAYCAGDSAAGDRLFAALYDEFHAKARLLLGIGPRQSLCITELVNETWM